MLIDVGKLFEQFDVLLRQLEVVDLDLVADVLDDVLGAAATAAEAVVAEVASRRQRVLEDGAAQRQELCEGGGEG